MSHPWPHRWFEGGKGNSSTQRHLGIQKQPSSSALSMSDLEPRKSVPTDAQGARLGISESARRLRSMEQTKTANNQKCIPKEIRRDSKGRRSLSAMGARSEESTSTASPESSSSDFALSEMTGTPSLTNSVGTISPSSTASNPSFSPKSPSPKMIFPGTSKSKRRSKRKSSQFQEEITESMGDAAVGEKRRRLETAPSSKLVDWSGLTKLDHDSPSRPRASETLNDEPLPGEDVTMGGS